MRLASRFMVVLVLGGAVASLAACGGEILARGDGSAAPLDAPGAGEASAPADAGAAGDGAALGDGAASGDAAPPGDGASPGDDAPPPPPPDGPTVTVTPTASDEVLVNPGLGFADFGWNPPADQYPPGSVAYRRWAWTELEPSEGQYTFALVDDTIAEARAKGEQLAFRIMTCWDTSSPQWLLDKGVASVAADDGVFPDHNNATFLDYHERLVRAFGQRYAGALDVDHVDIGSVGCWGEWNTACCSSTAATCEQYYPTEANQRLIIDWYFEHFPGTPLVGLVGAPAYAQEKGAGWRGDCFGDYGMFGAGWNHMENSYPQAAADPIVGVAWQTAPVQFEACGVMQDWYDRGFDIDLILQQGLEWHLSVFNGKSSPVPAAWRPQVQEWLKRLGYRLVITQLTHTAQVAPGGSLALTSAWENRGVAPIYHPWPLAWRLRGAGDAIAARWTSAADLRTWLPGVHQAADVVLVPMTVAPGTYALDVGVLTEDGQAAHVRLAITGGRPDLWYPVSQVTIE